LDGLRLSQQSQTRKGATFGACAPVQPALACRPAPFRGVR